MLAPRTFAGGSHTLTPFPSALASHTLELTLIRHTLGWTLVVHTLGLTLVVHTLGLTLVFHTLGFTLVVHTLGLTLVAHKLLLTPVASDSGMAALGSTLYVCGGLTIKREGNTVVQVASSPFDSCTES